MKKKYKFDSTQESIFTLLSLSIGIEQAFESMYGSEYILNSELEMQNLRFDDVVNDTIHEALVYQILLKSCAYLDEWDKIFGIRTEVNDVNQIMTVKKIAKPAYKCVKSWKELRKFRNQAIAHNHRDESGKNIYLNQNSWHSPQSNGEIFLLAYCIKSMSEILNFYFPQVAEMFVAEGSDFETERRSMEDREIREKIKQIDKEISDNLHANGAFDALMHK